MSVFLWGGERGRLVVRVIVGMRMKERRGGGRHPHINNQRWCLILISDSLKASLWEGNRVCCLIYKTGLLWSTTTSGKEDSSSRSIVWFTLVLNHQKRNMQRQCNSWKEIIVTELYHNGYDTTRGMITQIFDCLGDTLWSHELSCVFKAFQLWFLSLPFLLLTCQVRSSRWSVGGESTLASFGFLEQPVLPRIRIQVNPSLVPRMRCSFRPVSCDRLLASAKRGCRYHMSSLSPKFYAHYSVFLFV